ncbi:TonB family protein [Rhodocytophaga aerolata]|uniref:TonB family protein n=1 Tax=Rhodocytophaga aerolata TaxID=455078 RepID=A0ABT8RHG0_9BACT|nr:TonB family protein [Rhodocytophaga aerolata]MDO1451429.1 TonB family protein [Rhodocytophaga aerolata]
MPTHLLTYLLEVNSCLIVFYLFYYLVLRRETSFAWNRIYISGAVLLSLVLPLIDIPVSPQTEYLPKPPGLPALTIFAAEESPVTPVEPTMAAEREISWSWLYTIWLGYISICMAVGARLLWQIGRLLHFRYTYSAERYRHYTLVHTQGKLPTFSFFRLLFWDNSQPLSEAQQALILQHELAHIRQWHSADALLLEVLKVVCWFNPVVYWFRQSQEEVHEYLADACVTSHHDARQYSQIMVEQLFRKMTFTFTQSFNRSLINKRLAMIHLNKSTKPALWKLALSLPLLTVLFFVYSCRTSEVLPSDVTQATAAQLYRMGEVVVAGYGGPPVVKDANEVFNKYNLPVPLHKPEEVLYQRIDQAPTPVNGMEAFQKEIQQAIRAKAASSVSGTIHVQAIVDASGNIRDPKVLAGINEEYDLLAVAAIKNSPKWNPGKVNDAPVANRIVIPVVLGKPSATYSALAEVRELSQKPAIGEPMPQEGMEAIYKYMMQNLKYPQEARSAQIEGQVVVGFMVRTDGTLANIGIEEGVFPALDAEVVRVIQESGLLWKPAMENGRAKESRVVLPVTFKLG